MKRLLLTAAVVLALGGSLAACATATPYQPAPAGKRSGYGFSDYKVDNDHFRVTFTGNSVTSRETVEKYLLYRAAELTLQQGADWFDTTDRKTDKSTSYYADTGPYYGWPYGAGYGWGWRPYWRYYGAWGWSGWDPWYGSGWNNHFDVHEVTQYEASAEIVIGRGSPPSGHRVFNAHEVVANLGPSIVRPTPG